MKTEPNDQAFPSLRYFGLTKREYFAGLAMQGLLGNCNHEFMIKTRRVAEKRSVPISTIIAEVSLESADALIAALNSEKSE